MPLQYRHVTLREFPRFPWDAVKVTGKRVIGAADRSPLGSRLTFQGWQTPGAWLYDAWWIRLDRETGGVP